MISFLNLEYFLAAAEQLNFTRAAKRLFISQQSLKQATQDLSEKEQQKRNAELVRNEINQLQDQPLTTRMIGYLKWGYVVLAIVSLLALLFGYWTWLR